MYGPHSGLYDRYGEYRRAIFDGDRQKVFRFYDQHNPGSRQSTDVNERLFGRCGCGECQTVRDRYQFGNMPMNDQTRKDTKLGTVNICDLCGSLAQGVAIGAIILTTSSDPDTYETIKKEVCPGCVGEIVALLEMTREPRNTGYREPFKRPEKDAPGLGELGGVQLETLLAEALQRAMQANRAIEGGTKPTRSYDSESETYRG